MPRHIFYNAPPHYTYCDGDLTFNGGDDAVVPDDVAEELLTSPYGDFREVEDRESLGSLSRAELDELAARLGVDDPGSLRNRAAVIAAIEESEADPGEQPESGVGHDNNDNGGT